MIDRAALARRRRLAAAGFVTLLLLSVLWPSPIVSINSLWIGHDLPIDELSFLGREAPSWDVVFWCVAGLFAIALLHSGEWRAPEFVAPVRELRDLRPRLTPRFEISALAAAITVVLVWVFADGPLMALAEQFQSDFTESAVRVVNRLGGGMNPALVAIFFFVAGVVYATPRWTGWGLAMTMSGALAGTIAQAIKTMVGRSRPELWFGNFHFTGGSASSFPSGHTVGAFAIAGVLVFGSRSRALQVIAFLLATGVGFARIFAFRHWPSDVIASALVGLATAWIFERAVSRLTFCRADTP